MGKPSILVDCHNSLVAQVKASAFWRVKYNDDGTMRIDEKLDAPDVKTNILRSAFETGEEMREAIKRQYASIDMELLLEFPAGVEANAEAFEADLFEDVIVGVRVAGDEYDGHEEIKLELADGTYTHPPEEESESGSFLRYILRATPKRS